MEERLPLFWPCEEGVVDFVGGQRRRQRQIAAGQPFGRAQEVGRDVFLFAGEERSGPPKADGHFVGDQRNAMLAGECPHPSEIPGWMHEHPRRPLDERLDDEAGGPVAILDNQPLQLGKAVLQIGGRRVPRWRAESHRRGNHHRLEQQITIGGMELGNVADAHRAQRVPVVGTAQAQKAIAPSAVSTAGLLGVILIRDFQGDFDRCCPAVGVKDLREPARRPGNQRPGQFDRRDAREPQERGVGNAVELLPNRAVDFGHSVSVDVAPERRDAVEIPASFDVDQEEAVGRLDDRRPLVAVGEHRREGVPDELVVPFPQRRRRSAHRSSDSFLQGGWHWRLVRQCGFHRELRPLADKPPVPPNFALMPD